MNEESSSPTKVPRYPPLITLPYLTHRPFRILKNREKSLKSNLVKNTI